jgi:hypothetical protein
VILQDGGCRVFPSKAQVHLSDELCPPARGRAQRCRCGRDGLVRRFRRATTQEPRSVARRLLSPHERRSNRKACMIHLEEAAMWMLRWLFLGSAAILAIASATAQTYDPSYPVCLQRWEWGGSTYFECAYTSWDQCRATTIGLAAMCVENPYWQRPQPRRSAGRLRSSAPY